MKLQNRPESTNELVDEPVAQRALPPESFLAEKVRKSKSLFSRRGARFVVPGVALALVTSGVAMASLSQDTDQAAKAVPAQAAPVDLSVREADQASRDQERTNISDELGLLASQPTAKPSVLAPAVAPPPSPSKTPSKTATPKPTKKATKSAPKVTSVQSGPRWTTEGVNVRGEASASSTKVTSAASGTKVNATGKAIGDWRQITLDKQTGWVQLQYLTVKEPKTPTPAAPSSSKSSSKSGKSSKSPSSSSSSKAPTNVAGCPSLSGLTAAAERVKQTICQNWPGISLGGNRAGSGSYHNSGQAIDAMITSSSQGQEIANYMRSNASRLGVTEVIYNHQIWTTQRSSEGWRPMSDRGGATANHEDHVHVSVGGSGG